jgi:hypothetical protein
MNLFISPIAFLLPLRNSSAPNSRFDVVSIPVAVSLFQLRIDSSER